MTERKRKGDRGEAETAAYLEARGYTVLDRQWRCRYGELDVVARSPAGTVCFVEVKTRAAHSRNLPREAVDFRKRNRLRNTAALWLAEHHSDAPARFDVAEVYENPDGALRVAYLEGAFE